MKHRKVLLHVLKKVLCILEGWFCGGRETEKKTLRTRTRTTSTNQASVNPLMMEDSRFSVHSDLSPQQSFLLGRILWTIWAQAQLQGYVKGVCACTHFVQWLSITKVSNLCGGEITYLCHISQALSVQWTLSLSLPNIILQGLCGPARLVGLNASQTFQMKELKQILLISQDIFTCLNNDSSPRLGEYKIKEKV